MRMRYLSASEIEKRLNAWADVTMLCLELKKAFLRKRYPELNETEISELIRKEHEIAEGYRMHNNAAGLSREKRR
jgi:hypothetical protein